MKATLLRFLLGFAAVTGLAKATTYYVSPSGSDTNAGTSTSAPWQTLTKVNATTFAAGDSVLFIAGGVWSGVLAPLGSGSSGSPITIDMYGVGSQPIINGPGTNASVTVSLTNQSYWIINNLEITNTQSGTSNQVTGIAVKNTGTSALNQVHIQNCYIHDVNSATYTNSNYNKSTGGIIFSGTYPINDILVQGCHIDNVTVEALRTSFTNGATQTVFRNNFIENVYGDGIVIHGATSGGLAEYNTLSNCCTTSDANFAGLWTYASTGSVVQFNEVYGQQAGGPNDGEAFDADLSTNGDTFQYNYTHDNKQGFMLFMGTAQNITVRYNISVNDGTGSGQKLFFQDGTSPGGSVTNHVYNNTFYVTGSPATIFHAGSYLTFENNILCFAGSNSPSFSTTAFKTTSVFENNCFYPSSITTTNGPAGTVSGNITSSPSFVNAGASDNQGRSMAANYRLTSGSPCIAAGLVISGNGGRDFYGVSLPSTAPDMGALQYVSTVKTSTLTPTADSFVRNGTYASTNYGTSTVLTVKADATSYFRQSYITFSLSGVAAASAGSASLRLYVSGVNTQASRTISFFGVNASWTETGITWNNAPTGNAYLGATAMDNTAGVWYDVDVSADVQNAIANGASTVSFLLVNDGTQSSTNDISFSSKEGSNAPQLVISQ